MSSSKGPRFRLLTTNTKLSKSGMTYGLSLAPANTSGYEVCPGRTAGCTAGCVAHTGYAKVFKSITDARIAKTRRFFEDRAGFLRDLRHDLERLNDIAAFDSSRAYVRLNTFSDIGWENLIPMGIYTRITFYDYTKVWPRMREYLAGRLQPNYHLTWSVSEHPKSLSSAAIVLRHRKNVAVPMAVEYNPQRGRLGPLPETYTIGEFSVPVVDGDVDDRRVPWVDGDGVVVGLRFKGGKQKAEQGIESGFNRTVLTVNRQLATV